MSIIKRCFASPQQKQLLVQLVEADPQLRSGKFSSSFSKKDAERRWTEIGVALNAINGAKKTWEGWRKTWQDRKSNTKKKFAIARRQANMTGGGPPPKPPTDEDLLILSTMPSTSLVGHTDSHESVVQFIDINIPSQYNSHTAVTEAEAIIPQPTEVVTVAIEELTQDTEVMTSEGEVQTNAPPTEGITQSMSRPMTRQQRLNRTIQAAETLNEALQEKNRYKKLFYEQYINLMEQQCDALTKIADAINVRNSPDI